MSRYKCVKQHDVTDCGAACVATVCLQYKKETTITRLRELTGTDARGTTVLGIVETLEKLGFEAKTVRITREAFEEKFTLPCIVRVLTNEGLTHFVVIHKILKNHFLVADLAKGLRKVEKEEFFGDFDVYAILCAPTSEFVADKTKKQGVFNRFFKLLLAQKKLFAIAVIGSVILTVLGIASSFFSKILMDEILPYNLKNQLLIFCIGFGIIGVFNVLMSAARQHPVFYEQDPVCDHRGYYAGQRRTRIRIQKAVQRTEYREYGKASSAQQPDHRQFERRGNGEKFRRGKRNDGKAGKPLRFGVADWV